jgi:hypothetical protein
MNKLFKVISCLLHIESYIEQIDTLSRKLDMLLSKVDLCDELYDTFNIARSSNSYQSVYKELNPLVTICIATFNRSDILINRALSSVLRQDYKNIEVIVVGDACSDDTETLMSKFNDSRIIFINLPERGHYPEDPLRRWMVAGTLPVNYALGLARGHFITHLDDDDEYAPDRITKLVNLALMTKADLVWHPFWTQTSSNIWKLNTARQFKCGNVTTSSILYHNWFRQIPWDINAHKYLEPGDWNRLRKFIYLDAHVVRYSEPLLKHY